MSQARQRGAVVCVADASHQPTSEGPTLLVQDTQAALMDLAKWYRGTLDALVVGVG
ncbi:UDP-N-acetylmuramoyl-tripeptide--D-alanyl-D-alanine ligase [compost metagenome]